MDEDFGNDFLTIEDENGEEFELEHILSIEHKGKDYALFLPADMEESDPDYGYIILNVVEEDGQEFFNSVDDEDELVSLYDLFMAELFPEEEDGGEAE